MIHKASRYVDSVKEQRLPARQAYVPAGFFFGWAVEAGRYNEEELSADDVTELLRRFKARELTAPEVFEAVGGTLDEETLDDAGYAFAESYLGWDTGQYFNDFEQLFAADLASLWHVDDTWANYERTKSLIGARYRDWQPDDDA